MNVGKKSPHLESPIAIKTKVFWLPGKDACWKSHQCLTDSVGPRPKIWVFRWRSSWNRKVPLVTLGVNATWGYDPLSFRVQVNGAQQRARAERAPSIYGGRNTRATEGFSSDEEPWRTTRTAGLEAKGLWLGLRLVRNQMLREVHSAHSPGECCYHCHSSSLGVTWIQAWNWLSYLVAPCATRWPSWIETGLCPSGWACGTARTLERAVRGHVISTQITFLAHKEFNIGLMGMPQTGE